MRAAAKVAVLVEGTGAKVTGGKVTRRGTIKTAEDWCEYYGVAVKDGVAILYKGVRDDYHTSQNRFDYTPGTIPVAPDWDSGKQECGGGLHFSPHPHMALAFDSEATKFVACPVALADIHVTPDGPYPEKVKAKGCCAPVWEVDGDGEKIEPAAVQEGQK